MWHLELSVVQNQGYYWTVVGFFITCGLLMCSSCTRLVNMNIIYVINVQRICSWPINFPIPLKHLNSYILLCCRNLQFFSISNTGQWFLVNKAATRALRILKLTSRSSRVLIIGNVFTIRIYFICIVDNWLYVSKRSLWNK